MHLNTRRRRKAGRKVGGKEGKKVRGRKGEMEGRKEGRERERRSLCSLACSRTFAELEAATLMGKLELLWFPRSLSRSRDGAGKGGAEQFPSHGPGRKE